MFTFKDFYNLCTVKNIMASSYQSSLFIDVHIWM